MNRTNLQSEFERLANGNEPRIFHSFCVIGMTPSENSVIGKRDPYVTKYAADWNNSEAVVRVQRRATEVRPLNILEVGAIDWYQTEIVWSTFFINAEGSADAPLENRILLSEFTRLSTVASKLPKLQSLPLERRTSLQVPVKVWSEWQNSDGSRSVAVEPQFPNPYPWLEHLHVSMPCDEYNEETTLVDGKLLKIRASVLAWDVYRASAIAIQSLPEDVATVIGHEELANPYLNIVLVVNKLRARRTGFSQEVQFTAKPWNMFCTLHEAGATGRTREELMAILYEGQSVNDNNLDQHAKEINKRAIEIGVMIWPDNRGIWRLLNL